jgi:hypothetical protein
MLWAALPLPRTCSRACQYVSIFAEGAQYWNCWQWYEEKEKDELPFKREIISAT